ncbi:MAG: hypothetical protein NDI60_01465 [Elusimicrobiales bacterium]|nr:hypothetical protein [Elusimicrobiales bacterium]
MKKTLVFSILALAIGTGSAFAHCGNCPGDKKAEAKTEAKAAGQKKGHDCGDCPMHKKQGAKKCGGMTCPEKMAGAQTVSKNIDNGVEVTITAKDAETAAKIQELAVVHYSPKAEKCPGCPTTVTGAKTQVANIEGGVKVTITGETPETVKKIQNASAKEHKGQAKEPKKEARAAKKYMCAMKCVEAAKPGKCPKCGMPMEEIK